MVLIEIILYFSVLGDVVTAMSGIDRNNIVFQCSTRCGHGYERY